MEGEGEVINQVSTLSPVMSLGIWLATPAEVLEKELVCDAALKLSAHPPWTAEDTALELF